MNYFPQRIDVFWHPFEMSRKSRRKTVGFLHSPKIPDDPRFSLGRQSQPE